MLVLFLVISKTKIAISGSENSKSCSSFNYINFSSSSWESSRLIGSTRTNLYWQSENSRFFWVNFEAVVGSISFLNSSIWLSFFFFFFTLYRSSSSNWFRICRIRVVFPEPGGPKIEIFYGRFCLSLLFAQNSLPFFIN